MSNSISNALPAPKPGWRPKLGALLAPPEADSRRTSWPTLMLFLAPALLVYAALTAYPVVRTFYNSFFIINDIASSDFVGLAHFAEVFRDATFLAAVRNTAIWSTVAPFLDVITGLLLALCLYAGVPFARFLRVAWFTPVLLSYVVVGIMWVWIYNYDWGPIDVALRVVGLGGLARPWLGNLTTALPSLIVVTTWMFVGFNMVVFLAALHSLPTTLLEAAHIDGAGCWRTVWTIMVPLVWPTAAALTVLCVIGKMKQFALVYVMTKGGPLWSTETVATYIIKRAFQWKTVDLGYPSAVATLWFLATLIVTLVLIGMFHRRQQLEF